MYIQVSKKDRIDWEKFLMGGPFEEISKSKNKVWIYTVAYEINNRDCMLETLIELDSSKRESLLHADSYLEYSKKRKKKGKIPGDPNLKYTATKYDFIEKIIDINNNLIIVATEDTYEYDHPVPVEENEQIESNKP